MTRLELARKADAALKSAGKLGAAAVFGFVALICLSLAMVAALDNYLPQWGAALIVAALFGIVALILAGSARAGLSNVKGFSRAHTARRLMRPGKASQSLEDVEARVEVTRARIEESLVALDLKTDLLTPLRDTAVGLGSLGAAVAAILRANKEPRSS